MTPIEKIEARADESKITVFYQNGTKRKYNEEKMLISVQEFILEANVSYKNDIAVFMK